VAKTVQTLSVCDCDPEVCGLIGIFHVSDLRNICLEDAVTTTLHVWHGWFFALFLFCAALVFSNSVHWILFKLLRRKQITGQAAGLGWGIQSRLGRPARAIFVVTCLLLVLPFAPSELSAFLGQPVHQALAMALVLAMGWFAAGLVYVFEGALLRRYDITVENNIRARQVRTQMVIFRRLMIGFILVLTSGCLLWTFHDERIWKAGTGLMASAGIASLILATAAKSTASNFLAGLQIALTSPIRIDDVVVVQGEWGRIEEITSAYVVIAIWDQRRMIVPLSYFIENSFTNWTRNSADILGTAFIYVDYSVPVEAMRVHLKKIAEDSPLWDKRVCGLQVTDIKENTMEIRCLVSSRNSSESFDLRCLVREEMIAFLRDNYPESFPRMRLSRAEAPSEGAELDGERRVPSREANVNA
jgi:small-conductance mechanosensitive channel